MIEASDFGTGQVFWSMLAFFLFFICIWLLIVVFGDIVRSHDLGGWAKALWTIFVIVPSVTAAYSARQSSSRPRPSAVLNRGTGRQVPDKPDDRTSGAPWRICRQELAGFGPRQGSWFRGPQMRRWS